MLAGGLRRPVEEAIGVSSQVEAKRLLDLLRVDAEVLKTVQTRSQKVALDGAEAGDDDFWIETEAGRKLDHDRDRKAKKAALARLADPYGRG